MSNYAFLLHHTFMAGVCTAEAIEGIRVDVPIYTIACLFFLIGNAMFAIYFHRKLRSEVYSSTDP